MQRAVINRPARVRITIEDDAGTLVDVDDDLAVVLKDADGVTVASGTATNTGTGRYAYSFSRPTLGVLTVTYSGTVGGLAYGGVELVRLVDRRAESLARLRTDPTLSLLSTEDFLEAVDGAEDSLETALRYRVVSTADRVSVSTSRGQRVLRLPGPYYLQAVTAAQRDGSTLDPGAIAVRAEGLELPTAASWDFLTGGAPTGTWLPGAYTLDITHGMTETPADVKRAILLLARHNVTTQTAYPDRASKIVSAETEIWFARSGPDSWFGIPEVDAVVSKRRFDLPIADNPTF